MRRLLYGILASVILLSLVALPQRTARAQTPVSLAMFYYGAFTDTIRSRLVANPPRFVVLNTPGGSYRTAASPPTRPNAADIAALHGAGISVISYISTGNMVQFKYAADSPPNDRTFVRTGISNVAAEGCDGVFFDEGGVGNWRDYAHRWTGTIAERYYTAPALDMYGNANSWSGYTIEDYLDYAHGFGMITVLGTDFYEPYPPYSYGLSTNVFPITDYILTDEAFFSRAPGGSEIGHESQCWVIGYGLTNAVDAASYTNNALDEGFAASYHCASYGSLAAWYETYYGLLAAEAGPSPPTNVAATDGTSTSKVTITWTKSPSATGYRVYRDGFDISGALGDVATFDDVGAANGFIAPGSTIASDGASTNYVSLFLSGTVTSHGPTYSYKVHASNADGISDDSNVNTGYVGIGSLLYQWQRSAADSNAAYSNLTGATTATYSDTTAPVTGTGRYYRAVLNAPGASEATSTPDRGYRLYNPPPVTTVPPVPTPTSTPSNGSGGGMGIALFIFGTLAVIFVILEPSGTARDALGRFTKR